MLDKHLFFTKAYNSLYYLNWDENIPDEESAPDDFDIIWEKEVQRTISTIVTRDEYKVTTEKLFIHKSLNDKTDSDDF